MSLLPHARSFAWSIVAAVWLSAIAPAATLRVVTYNIEADIDNYTTARPGLTTVLEAIGQQKFNGVMQPLDILALEETTKNTTTLDPIVLDLNTYYGAAIYARSPYQATQSGSANGGNGPNGLIYNTSTLTLLTSVGIGTPHGSTNGEYRQVVRYQFEPVGGTSANDFYIYVSHMKSSFGGITEAILKARDDEANIIRNDAMTLSPTASILYMGDFNLSGSSESAYKTFTKSGQGQGVDPMNISLNYDEDWSLAAYKSIMTDSTTSLQGRTDIQFMSPNVYAGTSPAGLHYIAGSYHAFGNNGSTSVKKSTNLATNTSLNNLMGPLSASDVLAALVSGSDHLPVVADYTIVVVPEPGILILFCAGLLVVIAAAPHREKKRRVPPSPDAASGPPFTGTGARACNSGLKGECRFRRAAP